MINIVVHNPYLMKNYLLIFASSVLLSSCGGEEKAEEPATDTALVVTEMFETDTSEGSDDPDVAAWLDTSDAPIPPSVTRIGKPNLLRMRAGKFVDPDKTNIDCPAAADIDISLDQWESSNKPMVLYAHGAFVWERNAVVKPIENGLHDTIVKSGAFPYYAVYGGNTMQSVKSAVRYTFTRKFKEIMEKPFFKRLRLHIQKLIDRRRRRMFDISEVSNIAGQDLATNPDWRYDNDSSIITLFSVEDREHVDRVIQFKNALYSSEDVEAGMERMIGAGNFSLAQLRSDEITDDMLEDEGFEMNEENERWYLDPESFDFEDMENDYVEFDSILQQDTSLKRDFEDVVGPGENFKDLDGVGGNIGTIYVKLIKSFVIVTANVIRRYIKHRDHDLYCTIYEELLTHLHATDIFSVPLAQDEGFKKIIADVWGGTKEDAISPFKPGNKFVGTTFLEKLKKRSGTVFLTGSSTGCIFLCEMLNKMKATKAKDPSAFANIDFKMILVVPACTFEMFHESFSNQDFVDARDMVVFSLSDEDEINGFNFGIYPRSTLYLACGIAEDHDFRDQPIVGMQRFFYDPKIEFDPDEQTWVDFTRDFLKYDTDSSVIVWSHTENANSLKNTGTKHMNVISNKDVQHGIGDFIRKHRPKTPDPLAGN